MLVTLLMLPAYKALMSKAKATNIVIKTLSGPAVSKLQNWFKNTDWSL